MGVLNENKAGAAHRVGENPTTPTFIYCRGGDKSAPTIAKEAGMRYGIRYDYTAYGDVYMLDGGLNCNWTAYQRKVKKHKPTFALVPDYYVSDPVRLSLYIQDLRDLGVPLIGVCPKFDGAIAEIPNDSDIVLCISIPTVYAGYLPPDSELRPQKYHLLGGDIRQQIAEMQRIHQHGGTVVSMDGNKIAMKAANGQIWNGRKWEVVQDTTLSNTLTSARNIMRTLQAETPVIRLATENDIPAIKDIANQYRSELGYVMIPSLKRGIEHQELHVAEGVSGVIGFVNWHKRRDGFSTIYEIAVTKHRHGERIGAALLEAVPKPLRLKCTVDNDKANGFYAAQGMQLISTETGRKRKLNVWISPS